MELEEAGGGEGGRASNRGAAHATGADSRTPVLNIVRGPIDQGNTRHGNALLASCAMRRRLWSQRHCAAGATSSSSASEPRAELFDSPAIAVTRVEISNPGVHPRRVGAEDGLTGADPARRTPRFQSR